jgi:hypothetical protein
MKFTKMILPKFYFTVFSSSNMNYMGLSTSRDERFRPRLHMRCVLFNGTRLEALVYGKETALRIPIRGIINIGLPSFVRALGCLSGWGSVMILRNGNDYQCTKRTREEDC